MLSQSRNWRNPFGDGDAAQRIVLVLRNALEARGVNIFLEI
jgi:UDP-N-acetylglucosamine 2-epimerase